MSKQSLFFVLTLVGISVAAAGPSPAATLNLNLVYADSWTDGSLTSNTAYSLTDGGVYSPGLIEADDVHRFEYRYTITDEAADETIQYIQTRATGNGWTGYFYDPSGVANPSHDPPGIGAGLNPRVLWVDLFDAGTNGDLIGLTAIADGEHDFKASYRYHPGETPLDGDDLGTDFYLGDLYLTLNPAVGVTHTLTLQGDNAAGRFMMWRGGTADSSTPAAVSTLDEYDPNIVPDNFSITIVPEPSGLLLALLAAPALCLARRFRCLRRS